MNQTNNQGDFWEALRNLRKSSTDKKIAGVCGGFGEHTPIPAWIWRAVFLILVFAWGLGLIAYIILWICMPPADEKVKSENEEASPSQEGRLDG
ncbi:MAG: PspC domain-containing protein [Deltaproteobacteria bacterium]|nr:PspC domain-containing protein [Deltaproteobacteria bacterium]